MRAYQVRRFARSVGDPRSYSHLLRMVHYYNYTQVSQRRRLHLGAGTFVSPTVSFDNAERIWVGDGAHLGAGCVLWAGRTSGRIVLGRHALLGPGVVMSASDYDFDAGAPVVDQARIDQDILVGDDVWLGAGVIVVAGTSIGDGCVVGAGSVVTGDLPAGAVAVGNPARVCRYRRGFPGAAEPASDVPEPAADAAAPAADA